MHVSQRVGVRDVGVCCSLSVRECLRQKQWKREKDSERGREVGRKKKGKEGEGGREKEREKEKDREIGCRMTK